MTALLWFRRDLRLGDHPALDALPPVRAATGTCLPALCLIRDWRRHRGGADCSFWATRCGNSETISMAGYS